MRCFLITTTADANTSPPTATLDDKGEGAWGPIENIGYPVNTSSDDFGIIFNEAGTCGHFSSDREGGVGRDDIYSLRKTAAPLEVFVYDAETKEHKIHHQRGNQRKTNLPHHCANARDRSKEWQRRGLRLH